MPQAEVDEGGWKVARGRGKGAKTFKRAQSLRWRERSESGSSKATGGTSNGDSNQGRDLRNQGRARAGSLALTRDLGVAFKRSTNPFDILDVSEEAWAAPTGF